LGVFRVSFNHKVETQSLNTREWSGKEGGLTVKQAVKSAKALKGVLARSLWDRFRLKSTRISAWSLRNRFRS